MSKTFVFGYSFFKRTKELEAKINSFLMNIIQAGVYYKQALNLYADEGITKEFVAIRRKVSALESENDLFRRTVETDLYAHMLLPDMRSDILKLLEGCDKIINKYESNLMLMSIEQPMRLSGYNGTLKKLVAADIDCVDALISGVKDFFAGKSVSQCATRVCFYEHKADKLAVTMKEYVFQNKQLDLAHQLQLKEFIYNIEKISDIAEDVSDVLKIMAVKHLL